MPFPPTQFIEVYGQDFTFHLAAGAYHALAKERFSRPCTDSGLIYLHLPDVQGYLQEEMAAAYKFLADPSNADLWQLCMPQLASAVRARQIDQIKVIRQDFKNRIQMKSPGNPLPHSTTAALAWATLVESALLTEQLVQDMKESAAARQCACAPDGWMPYFLPNPPPEARQAFNDYVRCRWPIYVFALDPAAQQQNLADTFSGRREMQLAMSLAFVKGQLSARNMMRFARRIEFDFATVDLNGTAIGFSHGNDTFGWRFYPRFQTPDIESNLTVLGRDLLLGGPSRDALLRQRRLEPGMRECVAVIIMPSFVPYASLNVSSNWFSLTNPKCKLLDSTDAMRLSKQIKSIHNCAMNVSDAECYRDGDFDRLLQKAKQLETRLPLQSTMVQIPYENTLGGFAMFNTGVTDLAPELTGWYGSPSINPTAPTTVFLVGNHFSVHLTRVIAGGQYVSTQEMLSRQVMKVVIPANAILVGDSCQKFVDVHLATPYGVTQHLLIPVCNPPDAAGQQQGVVWDSTAFEIAFTYGGLGVIPPADAASVKFRPPGLVIQKGDVDPAKYPTVDIKLKFDKQFGVDPIVLPNIAYDSKKEGYAVSGDLLAGQVFATFGIKFGPETTNPPCTLVVAAAELKFTPKNGGGPLEKKAGNALTISWTKAAQAGGLNKAQAGNGAAPTAGDTPPPALLAARPAVLTPPAENGSGSRVELPPPVTLPVTVRTVAEPLPAPPVLGNGPGTSRQVPLPQEVILASSQDGTAPPRQVAQPIRGQMAWEIDRLDLSFVYKDRGIGIPDAPTFRPLELTLAVPQLAGVDAPSGVAVARMKLTLAGPAGKAEVVLDGIPVGKGSTVRIADAKMEELVRKIFDAIGPQYGPEGTNPPAPVVVSQAEVAVSSGNALIFSGTTTNAFRISWVRAYSGRVRITVR